ncbi:dipeptidase [Aeoliella mucimassa]|uniref:Membrane dipeptidase (Peptidase family M19) n=1 Tax=Aeoliella mucimassa TaxID=2527972 RepID=A0A518AS81_9BACT|nr:dipeptidase [Aeoliella mucimassa]QDU57582.1 Membrane dipeptidase (Peptidase family M19) [Aeoliella mucimassa]
MPKHKSPSPTTRLWTCVLVAACCTLAPFALAEDEQDSTLDYGKPIVVSERAKKLHAESLLIDGHNDMPWEIRDKANGDFDRLDISKWQSTLQTDIPRLRQGGVGGQFWSVWVPADYAYRNIARDETIRQIELVRAMIRRYPEAFELALTSEDITRIHSEGKIASLIGVEGGHCIEGSLTNLEHLYSLGARYMTLTHSDTIPWADSATDDPKHGGLTDFGVQVIERMNEIGMMVDISHVSPETMHDALDASKAPIIFSHSSARSVADSPRNVPDEVLKRLNTNDEDGVVMVNFFSGFLVPEAIENYKELFEFRKRVNAEMTEQEAKAAVRQWRKENPMPRGTIHHLLDHIDHIAEVAGAEHIGIGSDYDGVSTLPAQLDDVTAYPYITQGLIDRGYSDEEIRGILGGNLLRVMRKAEQVAEQYKSEQ